jgi:hypothetical protein
VYKAFRELGRAIRTITLLRFLSDRMSFLERVFFPAMLLPIALFLPLRALGVSDGVVSGLWTAGFMILVVALGIPWTRREPFGGRTAAGPTSQFHEHRDRDQPGSEAPDDS